MIFFLHKSIALIIFIFIFICSCQPRISKHGNFFDNKKINYIQNTKLNKSEIQEIFGIPTTTSTFSNNVWYYISIVQQEKAYFEVKNLSNTVLKITFDKNQNVKNYEIYTEKDSINIKVNDSYVASNLKNNKTLIQEFFSIFIRRLETNKP